eukprot:scaffold1362_cov163-Amphora_coffeaeformis.AAC.22
MIAHQRRPGEEATRKSSHLSIWVSESVGTIEPNDPTRTEYYGGWFTSTLFAGTLDPIFFPPQHHAV